MIGRRGRRPDHGPIVGILAGHSPAERYSLHAGYVTAVVAVGGFPVILPVGHETETERLKTQVLACDALIVSDGGDVDPELSRIPNPADALDSDRARDDAEVAAVHFALESGRPVLGICRGIHVLTVAAGGSLVGDVESAGFDKHDLFERRYETVHAIRSAPGSIAAQVLGTVTEVNSVHHQAVAELSGDLKATAWAPDGSIEAVEGGGALGIQWHPELLHPGDARFLAPFRWLIS